MRTRSGSWVFSPGPYIKYWQYIWISDKNAGNAAHHPAVTVNEPNQITISV